ncbi:MAG: hypothetical protein JXM73_20960 [Anaerolineae bacterium]|nr:hypothetical protein [Anaerolineae bacterium]
MKTKIQFAIVAGLLLATLTLAGAAAQGPRPPAGSATAGQQPLESAPLQASIDASSDTVNFQGRLYDSGGNPVTAGNYNMEFYVCSDSGCASTVWGPNEFTAVVDAEGLFNVLLTGFGADHFTADRWLRVRVCTVANANPCLAGGGSWDDMTPYQQMTSVAIAIGNIRKNMQDTSTASVPAAWMLTVQNTGSGGAALFGIATDAIGVRGNSTSDAGVVGWSSTWHGVYGMSTDGYGVYGTSPNSYGVRGYSSGSVGVTAHSVNSVGLYSSSENAGGIQGYAASTTNDVDGVTGVAATASYYRPPAGDSAGVVGSVATEGDHGVFGINSYSPLAGEEAYGVVGVGGGTSFSLPPDGWSAGVVGSVGTADDVGVFGSNAATTGQAYGVIGMASTTMVVHPASGSVGVLGSVTRSGDYGVYGANNSTSGGYGVYGSGYYGVYGYSANAYGVYGRSDLISGRGGYFYAPGDPSDLQVSAGAYGRNDADSGFGLAGHNYWSGVGVGAWSYGGNLIEAYDGDYPGGLLRFYVDQSGNLYADGTYYTFVQIPSPDGVGEEYRTLNSVQSPEAWIEDFGTAALVDGAATVAIEPVFAQTVNLEEDYHVYLTPLCDEAVLLFVTAKDADSFAVQGVTLDGTPSQCAFDYRVVVRRLGYEDMRLELLPVDPMAKAGLSPERVDEDGDGEVDAIGVKQASAQSATAQPQQVLPVGSDVESGWGEGERDVHTPR